MISIRQNQHFARARFFWTASPLLVKCKTA